MSLAWSKSSKSRGTFSAFFLTSRTASFSIRSRVPLFFSTLTSKPGDYSLPEVSREGCIADGFPEIPEILVVGPDARILDVPDGELVRVPLDDRPEALPAAGVPVQ